MEKNIMGRGLAISLLVITFGASVNVIGQSKRESHTNDIAGKIVSINLGRVILTTKIWGEGETIIMLPALGADISPFEALAPKLAMAGFQVVAVNPRGIAGSTGVLEGLTLHDYAKDIASLIEKLGIHRAHVLGWAGGNRMARCLAADHPELVQTVTLLAAGGKIPPDKEAGEALARLINDSKISAQERLELRKRYLFSPKSTVTVSLSSQSWPEATKSQQRAILAVPLDAWWSGGTAPMLVIQGLDDRIAPPGNGRALKESYGDRVRLIELEAAGHALVVEQPKAIVEAVAAFLREHKIATRKG